VIGARAVVRSLEKMGTEYTFGMPGAQNLELFDALVDSNIKNILVTNELFAAFMAEGYSQATGRVGVCLAIPGPGLTNMATGLAEAYLDSCALVVLVAGLDEPDKEFYIHQIRQLEVVGPIVKAVFKIEDTGEIPSKIYDAFDLAQQGEPGPVVVEINKRLFKRRVEFQKNYNVQYEEDGAGDKDKIKQITEVLINADSCGIYAGGGALSAGPQIKQLAEMFSMPVATTISGRGVIPEDHPLSVGFGFGPSGSKLAEDIFKQCDVILALGCKFSEMSTGSWGMDMPDNLVHIDANEEVFNKNYPSKITLRQDIKTALEQILELVEGVKKRKNSRLMDEIRKYREGHSGLPVGIGRQEPVSPSRFFHQLRKTLDRDAILVTDCGNHQLWAISDFMVFEPGTFITPADYQAMGFGIPAAIGAKIGRPDKKVICVCGDGGFLISGFEVLTAIREKLDLVVVVFNDGALGLIKNLQERFYLRSSSVDLTAPDYGMLAKSLGMDYARIDTEEGLADILKEALAKKGVVLVDVKVSYDQLAEYIKGMERIVWGRLPLSKKAGSVIKMINRKLLRRKPL